MNMLRTACLSLMLLTAPFSLVWGDEPGKENPQIAKTASKVSMPKAGHSTHAARVQKDKESVRKIVLAKKMQRQTGKKADKLKKAPNKKMAKKSMRGAKRPTTAAIPTRMGIRTWAFPESSAGRTNKITELNARIQETENAYDSENAKFQKLLKQSKEQANPMPGSPVLITGEMASSQRRLNDILLQLDALHNHRNEVSDLVFLKTVRD